MFSSSYVEYDLGHRLIVSLRRTTSADPGRAECSKVERAV